MNSVNGFLLLREVPHYVSSPFGYRIHPITHKPQGHNGVDYATYGKKPLIYCPFDGGKVIRVGKDRYGALFVYISFKELSYVGLAYHCSKIICKVGQKLNKGDAFANVGNTGRSTGEHLHWSWIVLNRNWNQYYNADYVDFEKFEYKEKVKDMEQKRYNKVNEMPKWSQKTIQDWIDRKIIIGDKRGNLDLSDDMIRMINLFERRLEQIELVK